MVSSGSNDELMIIMPRSVALTLKTTHLHSSNSENLAKAGWIKHKKHSLNMRHLTRVQSPKMSSSRVAYDEFLGLLQVSPWNYRLPRVHPQRPARKQPPIPGIQGTLEGSGVDWCDCSGQSGTRMTIVTLWGHGVVGDFQAASSVASKSLVNPSYKT